MFPFERNLEKQDIGMFELPARHKLLEAKRATVHNKKLSALFDKMDDLVAVTGSLTRLMLEYFEKHYPAHKADKTHEYGDKGSITPLDSQFDEFLRSMTANIDERIAALQAGESHSPCGPISPPSLETDIEALHNGMIEQRLRRLLPNDEEDTGGNE